jgi:hypothetical protein
MPYQARMGQAASKFMGWRFGIYIAACAVVAGSLQKLNLMHLLSVNVYQICVITVYKVVRM